MTAMKNFTGASWLRLISQDLPLVFFTSRLQPFIVSSKTGHNVAPLTSLPQSTQSYIRTSKTIMYSSVYAYYSKLKSNHCRRSFRRETHKSSGWCFEPPLPFKKPIVTLQEQKNKSLPSPREDFAEQDIPSIFHRVLLSVSNVKSVVKKTVTAAWMDHQQAKG